MERVFAENLGNQAWFEDNVESDVSSDEIAVINGRVYVEIEHLDHDILKATVKSEGIETPVLGVAFHLEYQKDLFHFLRYDPGNFLEKGGDPFYIVSDLDSSVVFGSTLRRDDKFPVGDGEITSIYFQKDDAYSDKSVIEFKFTNGVVSGMDETRQDIDKVNFENFSSAKVKEKEEVVATSKEPSVLAVNSLGFDFQQYILGVLSTFGVIFLVIASVIFVKYIKDTKARRKI